MRTHFFTAEENPITNAEAAAILGIHIETLKNGIRKGKIDLRPRRFGHRTVRYIEAEVLALRAKRIATM